MTLPNKFIFFYAGSPVVYTATVQGQQVLVEWDDEGCGKGNYQYDIPSVVSNIQSGTWNIQASLDSVVAAPVPSLIEQLVSVAAAKTYDVTFEPAGAIRLTGAQYGSRSVRLKSVELALQWFGLMAQLKALETDGA